MKQQFNRASQPPAQHVLVKLNEFQNLGNNRGGHVCPEKLVLVIDSPTCCGGEVQGM